MRLLLDEMHAPRVAELLRSRGIDAVAVKEQAEWAGLPDDDLLVVAATDRRALVTENVKDFAALSRAWSATGRRHAGLVFTHPRRFDRAQGAYVRRLADALAAFVDEPPQGLSTMESFEWWLEANASRHE